MSPEVRKDQPDPHPSAQIVRTAGVEPVALSRDRGRQWPLFGPADGSSLDLHRIELRPGAVAGHYHHHPASENVYVLLEGAIDVRHPGGTAHLEPGDAIRFPPGVPHAVEAIGADRAILLELYAPAPADFVLVGGEPDHPARRS